MVKRELRHDRVGLRRRSSHDARRLSAADFARAVLC